MHDSLERDSPAEDERSAVEDWRGIGDLVGLATERLAAPVEGMHRAIAGRWFGLAGPKADPLALAYDSFIAGTYGSVRLAGSGLGRAMSWGAACAASRQSLQPVLQSGPGRGVQAVANAVWGDELERRSSPLRIDLGLRDGLGRPIASDPDSLATAFAESGSRLVVLLHGLGETEACWQGRTDHGEAMPGLGDVLAADSFTPLLIRYNTGRHVSHNGAELADFLEVVVRGWPVAVNEVVLVGSSMGGLVARGALHAGLAEEHGWVDMASHVVTLGSPHLGAPLEKVVNLLSRSLCIAPESRPIAQFLDRRSAGIKDLRFGAIRDDDWTGHDPDELLTNRVVDIQRPKHVEYHFIAGVITEDPAHPVGRLVGDLVVRAGSAAGRGRRRRIQARDVHVVGGRRHFDLPHDSVVQQQVRDWLKRSEPRPLCDDLT